MIFRKASPCNTERRKKPWGTGQAVLACCKDLVNEPFLVINADDYYGKEGFVKNPRVTTAPNEHGTDGKCMTTAWSDFILENTLSENGAVTRGVCKVNANGTSYRTSWRPTISARRRGRRQFRDGKAGHPGRCGTRRRFHEHVGPSRRIFLDVLAQAGFPEFLDARSKRGDVKAEYLLPDGRRPADPERPGTM